MDKKEIKKLEALEKFYESIKREVRNLGRSNIMMKSKIQDVLDQFLEDLSKKEEEEEKING